jgi:hypothetical protein
MLRRVNRFDALMHQIVELRPLEHARALARSWQGWLILLVVAGGLAVPIHYYVPTHRDPHDERFAWRMFSPMRMAKCEPKFTKNNAPLDLGAEFHEAWIELAKRGRFHIIERMGAQLCEKYPNTDITINLPCTYLHQAPEHYGGYNVCMVPYL